MATTFGARNPALTKAINRVANGNSIDIRIVAHAERAMADDGFDHADVFMCLRRGSAYRPEFRNGELRANVLHRGVQIRVSVGSIEHAAHDWSKLDSYTVVTVMRES